MKKKATDELLQYLINLTGEIAGGEYDHAMDVFEFTKTDQYPELITNLAESFGMMMVKIEAREFRLEQMIEDLNQKNMELEKTLEKVKLLENIKKHLGRFVPESVKKIIETAPEAPDLEKRKRDVSVLFLDVAGYTKMSESVEPERMNILIEMYFSNFLDTIHQNKGDINETAGDGLMIIFQHEDPLIHARNAVLTALAVQDGVKVINNDLEGIFDPVVVNIGINSGAASVGSSRFEGITGTRMTFTASGPVTNVAARIGAKATRGKVFIGGRTAERVKDLILLEDVGKHRLKNVKDPVQIYCVLGKKEDAA